MGWSSDFVPIAQDGLRNAPDEVMDYLYSRGVGSKQVSEYQIGYCEEMPHDAPQDMKRQKSLSNFLCFPLTTIGGTVTGFQFRRIDRKIYLDYIEDESQPIAFGLAQAYHNMWESQKITIVEGPFDLFPVRRIYPSTVATLSAKVSEPLRRLFRRIITDIVIMYDIDAAGRSAAYDIAKEYRQTEPIFVHIPKYPARKGSDGLITKDPGSLWETIGEDAFRSIMQPILSPYT